MTPTGFFASPTKRTSVLQKPPQGRGTEASLGWVSVVLTPEETGPTEATHTAHFPQAHMRVSPSCSLVLAGSVWFADRNQSCSDISSPVVMSTFKTLSPGTRASPITHCSGATLSHKKGTFSALLRPPSLTSGDADPFPPTVGSRRVSVHADAGRGQAGPVEVKTTCSAPRLALEKGTWKDGGAQTEGRPPRLAGE